MRIIYLALLAALCCMNSNAEIPNVDPWAPEPVEGAEPVASESTRVFIPSPNHNRRGLHEPSTTLFKNPFTIPLPAPNCSEANYKLNCDYNIRYRTLDGSCNNLRNRWWGARLTPYQRLLEHDYSNHDAPKMYNNYRTMPNAGDIAVNIGPNAVITKLNGYFVFFGQYLSHDLVHTPKSEVTCDCVKEKYNPECFNIMNSMGACTPFARSDDVRDIFGCQFAHREQYSLVSHWTDLDILYGSKYKEADYLRSYDSGLLKWSITPGSAAESMPILDINKCITDTEKTDKCFLSGDTKNEFISQFSGINVIFLRMHNYIARGLHAVNPHWNDQIIYSESRRILIAIYQNIIYSEYLPILLGQTLINEFGLYTFDSGYSYSYDDSLYPNNYNEFGTAGFRLHGQINEYAFLKTTGGYVGAENLADFFFNQYRTFSLLEDILFGLMEAFTNAKRFHMATAVGENLFKDFPNEGDKGSLQALNIQRGRDHGLRTYAFYRKMAGQNLPEHFDELYDVEESTITALKQVYDNVKDIDLWVGLLAEKSGEHGIVGRTTGFLIARNFYNLKYGDRFYFENGEDKVNRFTEGQLEQIRNFRFSSLLCATLHDVSTVPRYGFYAEYAFDESSVDDSYTSGSVDDSYTSGSVDDSYTSGSVDDSYTSGSVDDSYTSGSVDDSVPAENIIYNPQVPCSELPVIDFEQWREYKKYD